ncbi:DUF1128 domain-containing protein [Paenactinomyces guangxiensis]|uniref:DUF1128 domain-containing protein n=1 Tax=Paenactinomyces guangxiensis TaxID=1490290 RepID=UPI0028682409|nr:DUF1128 family protein [Paenactinomyces guangxiensis]
MNLETATQENLEFIIKGIKANLKVVNAAIINPEDFQLGDYEEILDIYKMIQKKQGRLTMMEIEGVLEELKGMRKAAK